MKTKQFTIDQLNEMTRIDKWFLYKFNNIIEHCDIFHCDPSYKNQILVLTYPLIGNYGVPKLTKDELDSPKCYESEKIHAAGLVVGENYSHWNADKSLSQWLIESDVPGITGIDTRRLKKILGEKGSMLAKV